MRQKGTVQAPSSFLRASIHHPPIRGGVQWGHTSSWVWDGNTICSVSYCIHHCSMRELWERSALSKKLIEDVKSQDGFQVLLIFPSVSLSFMPRLNKRTASNSTHDASREIYKIGALSLRVCLDGMTLNVANSYNWVNILSLELREWTSWNLSRTLPIHISPENIKASFRTITMFLSSWRLSIYFPSLQ